MIDIHTHILPACDDGADNLSTSITEIRKMINAGVTDIVLTPHFIRNVYNNHTDVIESKFNYLQNEVEKQKIPITLYKGAEVYLDENIFEDIESENFNINNSDYILVETNLSGFPKNLLEILYKLVKNNYKPILAHPERYPDIIQNPTLAEDLIYRNVYFQINAGSLIGLYGKRISKTAWKLLSRGHVHFLASDTHCNNDEYLLPLAYKIIKKNFGEDFAKLLCVINPDKLLKNKNIQLF
jgi:protein-tyrosine phosphatase